MSTSGRSGVLAATAGFARAAAWAPDWRKAFDGDLPHEVEERRFFLSLPVAAPGRLRRRLWRCTRIAPPPKLDATERSSTSVFTPCPNCAIDVVDQDEFPPPTASEFAIEKGLAQDPQRPL
jgi:hypothetical protein